MGKVRTSILIVDKDPRTRALVEAAVDTGRVSVDVVGDVRAGWEAAKRTLPGLIVVDADLPKGWNLCTELKRKSKRLRQIPLILLSAKADEGIFHNHQSLPSRADAYLSKPLEDARFKTSVDLLLEYPSGVDEDEPEDGDETEGQGRGEDEDLELEFEIDMDDLLEADDEAEVPATVHGSSVTPVPSALDAAAMGEIDRMRKQIAELEIQLAEQRRSEGDRMREQAREGFTRLQALRDELEAAKRDADELRKAEDAKPETKPDDGALAEIRARNAALEAELQTLRTAGQGLEESSTVAARELERLRRQVEALEAERDALADRARADGEQADAAEALKARANEAESARERLAEALEVATTRMNAAETSAEAAEAAREATEKKAADAEQKAADAEQKAADAEKKTADAEKKAADAEKKAADAEKKAADAEKKAADAEKAEGFAVTARQAAEARAEEADALADKRAKAAEAKAEELGKALASAGELGEALAEREAERDAALARAGATDDALAKATEGLKGAEAASGALADELVAVRERLAKLSAERDNLNERAEAFAAQLEDAEERAGELLAGRDAAVDRAEAATSAEVEAQAALAAAAAAAEELDAALDEQVEQTAKLQQELADAVARGKALRDYATELEALHKSAEERNASEQSLAAEVDTTLRAALAAAKARTEAAEREATTSTEAARAALSGVRKLAKSLTNLAADATKLGELEPRPRAETKAPLTPELPAPPTYAPAEPLPEAPKLSIIVGAAVTNLATMALSTKRLTNAKGRDHHAMDDVGERASGGQVLEPLVGLNDELLEDDPEVGSQTMVFEMPPSSFDQIEAEVQQPPPLPPSLPPDALDEALAELDSLDPHADLGSAKRKAPPKERITDVDDWESLDLPD